MLRNSNHMKNDTITDFILMIIDSLNDPTLALIVNVQSRTYDILYLLAHMIIVPLSNLFI